MTTPYVLSCALLVYSPHLLPTAPAVLLPNAGISSNHQLQYSNDTQQEPRGIVSIVYAHALSTYGPRETTKNTYGTAWHCMGQ